MKSVLLACILFSSGHLCAQQPEKEILKAIAEKDSLFWVGYNTCNLELMAEFLAEDMEFYHDRGGLIRGVDGMKEAMEASICSDPHNKVRREAMPGTIKLFALRRGDDIYGVIVSGEHVFYNSYNGAKENRNSEAAYTAVWILHKERWVMNRILSYGHKDL